MADKWTLFNPALLVYGPYLFIFIYAEMAVLVVIESIFGSEILIPFFAVSFLIAVGFYFIVKGELRSKQDRFGKRERTFSAAITDVERVIEEYLEESDLSSEELERGYRKPRVFRIKLAGNEVTLTFMGDDSSTWVRVGPETSLNKTKMERFLSELDSAVAPLTGNDRRLLERPPDELMDALQGEQVLIRRHWKRFIEPMGGGLVFLGLYSILIFWAVSSFTHPDDTNLSNQDIHPFPFMLTFSLIPLLLVGLYLFKVGLEEMLTNALIINREGVAMMAGSSMIKRISFNGKVKVEIVPTERFSKYELKIVKGYKFSRGRKSIQIDGDKGYDVDDVKKAWPLVVAAAWEHKMIVGEFLDKLLQAERG